MQQFEWVRSFHGLLDPLTEAEQYPKDSPWDQEGSASWLLVPFLALCCGKTEGFFCFIVSKIERKDPGVLLFFCVGIPGAGAGRD